MQVKLLDVPESVTDRERAEEWSDQLEELIMQAGKIFPRVELERRVALCLRGLLAPVSRKNGWQSSEHGGESTPWGQQHRLDRSVWDVDGLREVTRRYVEGNLGGTAPPC